MEENLLINKDLAVKLCKSIELVYNSASELKSVNEDDYESIIEHFQIIGDFFNIKNKLGILLLCYFINRRLVKGKPYITLNELMTAFECTLVDSISINEQLEYFRKAKMLVSSKKSYGKLSLVDLKKDYIMIKLKLLLYVLSGTIMDNLLLEEIKLYII